MGEIVEWSKGSGLSKDALNIQGIGVPVIHYADLYKFNSVQKEVIHWTMNDIGTKIPENNLLFPMSDVTPDGLARTSTVLQSNVKAGGDVLIAKLNKDILSTFMSYQINRNKNQILPLVTGTTVRHINSKSLSTLKVTVPGKNEQKYVGSILMRFDSLIALHQRMLDEYKTLKKTMLSKIFPKNGEKYPELRFFGFTDAWELRKLGDIGSVAMNKRVFKHQTSDNGEIPFFKIGTFGGKADTFISRKLFEEYKRKYPYPNKGDILLSASGSIGKIVVYTGEDEYFQDSNIVWFKHDGKINNQFLKQFYTIVKWDGLEGSTIKRLYNKNILNTNILLPAIREQEKIGTFFKHLDSLITLHQRELELLKTLKKTMLQQMFV